MRLYHGSNLVVFRPLASAGRPMLDFGQGFYLTSYFSQAKNWAQRKALRSGGSPIINVFEMTAPSDGGLRILRFEHNDAEWVDFVCNCRKGDQTFRSYDVIVGGVADDKVFAAVDFYSKGLWTMEQTLEALRYYKSNDQYCFVSQRAIDECLSFVGIEGAEDDSR